MTELRPSSDVLNLTAASPTPVSPGCLVLLLDDPDGESVCRELLQQLGYDVNPTSDPVAAVRACGRSTPSALIVELQMHLSVIEQVRELQRHGRLPWFPVLALTTMSEEPAEHESRRLLTDGLLVRPLELRQVAVTLARAAHCSAFEWGRPKPQDGQSLSAPAPEDNDPSESGEQGDQGAEQEPRE